MSNDKTGGQAFPMGNPTHGGNDGMTMRDYFAGQALAESTRDIWDSHKYEDVAKRAYGIADAMLAERERTK